MLRNAHRAGLWVVLLTLACAARAQTTAAGGATAWGFVQPSHPGFSVVYLEGPPQPGQHASLVIRKHRIEPAFAVVGAGGSIEVRNASERAHTLAVPLHDLIRRIAPGDSLRIPVPDSGARSLFLLGEPGGAEATVFASPGPYAVVSRRGRFELRGLPSGRQRLRTWEPDGPGIYAWVDVRPDAVHRFDLEVR